MHARFQDAYPLFWSNEGKEAFRSGLQLLEMNVNHLCWAAAGVPPASAIAKQRSIVQRQQRSHDRRRRPVPLVKRNMLCALHHLMSELILIDE